MGFEKNVYFEQRKNCFSRKKSVVAVTVVLVIVVVVVVLVIVVFQSSLRRFLHRN
jgi:preprotein translocase subunit SecE